MKLGEPVKFVGFGWNEDWQFKDPLLILEPVLRYSKNGQPSRTLMMDTVIDVALALQEGRPPIDDSKKHAHKRIADHVLKKKKLPKKYYVEKRTFIFFLDVHGCVDWHELP